MPNSKILKPVSLHDLIYYNYIVDIAFKFEICDLHELFSTFIFQPVTVYSVPG